MAERNRTGLIVLAILLGMLVMVGPINIDTFLPAIPAIARGMGTDMGSIQFSVATVMLGNAIGQLVYGPLSDRFGRKPIVLFITIAYGLAAVAAAFSPGPEIFALWRFVQGLTSAGGRIIAGAAARDLYARERLGKFLSYVMMIGAMSSVFSPIIGGVLVAFAGWRSVFWFMAAFGGLLAVLIWRLFDETLAQRDHRALIPRRLLANFGENLRNRSFVAYVSCSSLAIAGLVAFLTSASTIVIGNFEVSEIDYGYAVALVMTGYVLATWQGARLVGLFGLNRTILIGAVVSALGGIAMIGLAIAGIHTTAAIMVPMGIYMVGFAATMPQATAGALTPFPHMSGTASSLGGFFQIIVGVLVATALSAGGAASQLEMATAVAVMALASLLVAIVIFASRIGESHPAGDAGSTDGTPPPSRAID